MEGQRCCIWGEAVVPFFKTHRLVVVAGRAWGQPTAHHPPPAQPEAEYHLVYEQARFLDSLRLTDLVAVLSTWLSRLTSATRHLVIKVPIQDGPLFRLARLLRFCGIDGPMRQLFQVGTWPPHFHYFSDRSLTQMLQRLRLEVVESWIDPDFEPEQLRSRVLSLKLIPEGLVRRIAKWVYARAKRTGRGDSRIMVVRRP